jgi:hypothetical protein
MYQLLPTYRAVQVGVTRRLVTEADIPGVERAQADKALAFHREIEEAVDRHWKDQKYLTQGYRVVPVVGVLQPTPQSGELLSGRLTVGPRAPEGVDPLLEDGDGTVPRLSAVPPELVDEYRQTYFPERHGSLQGNSFVLTHVRGILEQSQVVGLKELRGVDVAPEAAAQPAISLDLDDLYFPGEPVRFHVRLLNVPGGASPPEARIETVSGAVVQTRVFRQEGDRWVAEAEELPPGVYRLEARAGLGGGAPLPVHDLFEVVAATD